MDLRLMDGKLQHCRAHAWEHTKKINQTVVDIIASPWMFSIAFLQDAPRPYFHARWRALCDGPGILWIGCQPKKSFEGVPCKNGTMGLKILCMPIDNQTYQYWLNLIDGKLGNLSEPTFFHRFSLASKACGSPQHRCIKLALPISM